MTGSPLYIVSGINMLLSGTSLRYLPYMKEIKISEIYLASKGQWTISFTKQSKIPIMKNCN
jgi:hypothetical protein